MLFLLSYENVVLIVLLSIIIGMILIAGILFSIDYFLDLKFKKRLKKTLALPNNYIIDLQNETVEIFNVASIRKKRIVDLNYFLNLFDDNGAREIKKWITDFIVYPIAKDSEDEKFVLLCNHEVLINNRRHFIRTMLFCKHVDNASKRVFIEANPLKFTPTDTISKKGKVTARSSFFAFKEIEKHYNLGLFEKGAFVIIRFEELETKVLINWTKFKYLIMNVLNRMNSNMSLNFFFTSNENEIGILDLHNVGTYTISKNIEKIKVLIEKGIEVTGFSNKIDYYIYASLVSELPKKFGSSLEIFNRLAGLEKDAKRKYTIYKKEQNNFLFTDDGYKTEIDKIIRHQNIDIAFRPVAHIANKRVVNVGYMSFITLKNSIFKDVEDAKKYVKIYGKEREFFSLITRKIVPTFINERENSPVSMKLFLKTDIGQIPAAIRSLPHFSGADEISIVLCFDSKELIDLENDNLVIRQLKGLKEKGYQIGLFTNVNDYILKNATYEIFNYFLFNCDLGPNLKMNSMLFLKAHQFLDRLVKYDATIVSYNAPNMQTIELFVKAGIEDFSSDVISPRSPMLKPLDKKINKKLLNMYK